MEWRQKNNTLMDQENCLLAPGELVQHSGVYEVCHHDEDRTTVILIRNTIFPYCRRCGDLVRYKLLEQVPHISEDPDFQEDLPPDNLRYKMKTPTSTFPIQLSVAHGFRFHQGNLQAWPGSPGSGDL